MAAWLNEVVVRFLSKVLLQQVARPMQRSVVRRKQDGSQKKQVSSRSPGVKVDDTKRDHKFGSNLAKAAPTAIPVSGNKKYLPKD